MKIDPIKNVFITCNSSEYESTVIPSLLLTGCRELRPQENFIDGVHKGALVFSDGTFAPAASAFDNDAVSIEQFNRMVRDRQYIMAMGVLREQGFCVENLWHISDVSNLYTVSDLEAMEVLDYIMCSSNVAESINSQMHIEAREKKLNRRFQK